MGTEHFDSEKNSLDILSDRPILGPKSDGLSSDEHIENAQAENEVIYKIKVDATLSENDVQDRWGKVFKILLGDGNGDKANE